MSQLITIALLGLLVIILVPLFAPVRIRVVFSPEKSRVRMQWMLQYVEYQFPERVQVFGFWRWVLYQRPLRLRKPSKKKPRVEKKEPEKPVPLCTRARIAWHYRVIIRRTLLIAVRFVGRVLRSFHLQEGRLAMTIGLSDPAQTGMLTGLWYAVQPAVRQVFRRVNLTLIPDFNQPIMRLDGFFKLRLIPVEPVFHLARALGTLPWRGLWKLKKAWSS